ncbi:hypothetical protein [Sphingomonas endolithica]|uniref:hypothetical protein n=1 Tax=Sphingomonas endolithica TaxID=2972485 RepID=UPI0021AEDFD0|nr:hypothetical protein [Sphingomonas sp. ZFBP2030]
MGSGQTALEKKAHIADIGEMMQPDALPQAPPYGPAIHLPALPAGWHALHYRVLANGELAVVIADVDFAAEWERIRSANGLVYPPSRILEMADAGTARLLLCADGEWEEGPSFPLEFAYPKVDRFADGRWLVVGSRTNKKSNARVIASDGTILARFMLGDGIEHVSVDGAGNIWVGWFDEGIYGNSDWHVPGEEWPPSSRGIGCFDDGGVILPLAAFPSAAGMIADCYALTAVDDGAWACPYTDFPLMRLRLNRPALWWANDLAGPKALAVDGRRVLAAGGYGDKANRLALLLLEDVEQGGSAHQLAEWALPLSRLAAPANDWSPMWIHPTLLTASYDTIHLINDGVWHRWRVGELAELAGDPQG